MTLFVDTRRTTAIGIVALLLLAAAAPLCLMSAAPAMGMPAAQVSATFSDCSSDGDGTVGSMTPCPYAGKDEVPGTATSRLDLDRSFLAAASLDGQPAIADLGASGLPELAYGSAVLAPPTPLRL